MVKDITDSMLAKHIGKRFRIIRGKVLEGKLVRGSYVGENYREKARELPEKLFFIFIKHSSGKGETYQLIKGDLIEVPVDGEKYNYK